MTPDVTQAQALQNYELLITFADGEQRRSVTLPEIHRDPADRIIIATALVHSA